MLTIPIQNHVVISFGVFAGARSVHCGPSLNQLKPAIHQQRQYYRRELCRNRVVGSKTAHASIKFTQAKALIDALAAANDAQLPAFADHTKSNDAEHLAHLLLASCHFDLKAIWDTTSGKADLLVQ